MSKQEHHHVETRSAASNWRVHTNPIDADIYKRALADANEWPMEKLDVDDLFTSVTMIGAGSFGIVFRVSLIGAPKGEQYALKLFYNLAHEAERFSHQEALASLYFHYIDKSDCTKHPHVVCFVRHFRAQFKYFSLSDVPMLGARKAVRDDNPFYRCILTRFVSSETLRSLLEPGAVRVAMHLPRASPTPFTLLPFQRMLMTAADGLRSLHAAGLWHHDVKPDNIAALNSEDSRMCESVVLDLGGACTLYEECGHVHTREYTPRPVKRTEKWSNEEVFSEYCSRDVYALGVTFSQLANGNLKPLQKTTFSRTLTHDQHTDELLSRMMHNEWKLRPTAQQVFALLYAHLALGPVEPVEPLEQLPPDTERLAKKRTLEQAHEKELIKLA